jgi:hypothetical protein
MESQNLIAGPHVLVVIVRPYPAWANAVVPPTAVPEMATVSTGNESTGPKSRRHMDAPSSHCGCARPVSGREATSANASTAEACSATTEVCSAAATTEVCSAATTTEVCSAATTTEVCSAATTTEVCSAAMVLGRSIGSKRHAAKRDDCGQRKD